MKSGVRCSNSYSTIVIAFCLWVFLLSPTFAQSTIRIATTAWEGSPEAYGLEIFSEEVMRRTNGRLRVKVFLKGSLGNETELIGGLLAGSLDMSLTSMAPVLRFVPEARVFDVPFLFRSSKHLETTLQGPIGKNMVAKLESAGLTTLSWTEADTRHITTGSTAIRAPKDLRGIKIRVADDPLQMAAYKELGATPLHHPISETLSGLQKNIMEGQEGTLQFIADAKLDLAQKHLSFIGHQYVIRTFLIRSSSFRSYGDNEKKAFVEAAEIAAADIRKRRIKENIKLLASLRSRGMTVTANIDKGPFEQALASYYESQNSQLGQNLIRNIFSIQVQMPIDPSDPIACLLDPRCKSK